MNISIGSDHAGFAYKEAIKLHLEKAGHQVIDCGTFTEASLITRIMPTRWQHLLKKEKQRKVC